MNGLKLRVFKEYDDITVICHVKQLQDTFLKVLLIGMFVGMIWKFTKNICKII